MDNFTKKHLQDILNAIDDIETFFEGQPKLFEEFCRDIRLQRAIERCIEIIGEAMNRILKENKDIAITNARKIVDARNYIVHGYDSLSVDILWSIVVIIFIIKRQTGCNSRWNIYFCNRGNRYLY